MRELLCCSIISLTFIKAAANTTNPPSGMNLALAIVVGVKLLLCHYCGRRRRRAIDMLHPPELEPLNLNEDF